MPAKSQTLKTTKSRQKKSGDQNVSDLDSSQIEPDLSMKKIDDVSADIKEVKTELKRMLKKEDVEDLIKKSISDSIRSLEDRMKEEIKRQIQEKCEKLETIIESLQFENDKLKDKLESNLKQMTERINETEAKVENQEQQTREAIKLGNHNEQFSRKNNIKIMNVEEEPSENEEKLTEKVCSVLSKQGVDLQKEEIIAIHRLPRRNKSRKPVIIKTINNNVKTRVMRKRREMRTAGYRIADDVTKLNTGLISRLSDNENIDSAWYFNGSVFGRTKGGKRLKFELFDDINQVITKHK